VANWGGGSLRYLTEGKKKGCKTANAVKKRGASSSRRGKEKGKKAIHTNLYSVRGSKDGELLLTLRGEERLGGNPSFLREEKGIHLFRSKKEVIQTRRVAKSNRASKEGRRNPLVTKEERKQSSQRRA